MEVASRIKRYKQIDSPVCRYVNAYGFMNLMVNNCKLFSGFVYRMLEADFSVIPYYFRNGSLPRKFENSIVENLTIARRKAFDTLARTSFDSMKNAAYDMIDRIRDAELTFPPDEPEDFEMRMRLTCSCDENLLSIHKFPVKLRIEGSEFMSEATRDIRLTKLKSGDFHIEIWQN